MAKLNYNATDMKHRGWIVLSGCLWFLMGGYLLAKGISFLSMAKMDPTSLSSRLQGSVDQASTLLLLLGLSIGFLKGRFVLSKTVARMAHHIYSLPLPIRFFQVYPPSYWILILVMMSLGMGLRYLAVAPDFRGVVNVAIGSALIQGAGAYFRMARIRSNSPSERSKG